MRQWDLTLLFKNEEEYYNAIKEFERKSEECLAIKGTLKTLEGMKKYCELSNELGLALEKIFSYTSFKNDLNQKDVKNTEDYSRVYTLYMSFMQKIAWVDPEILSVGYDKVMEFCKDPVVAPSKFNFEKLFRKNRFVMDEKSEGMIATFDQAVGNFNKLYDNLDVMDRMPINVTLSDGRVVEVTSGNYASLLLTEPKQEDRKTIFEEFYKYIDLHKNTYAGIYNGIMQSEYAESKIRGYESTVEMSLFKNAIDVSVYENLVKTTRENAAPLKRYVKLREKYLGLSKYHTYDRFLSLVESEAEYPYDKTREMVIDACGYMGEDFKKKAEFALTPGRVSVDSADGKATGAYSGGTYTEGPFILLNFQNTMEDAFTLAHECGHSIHTLYANEAQPFETAGYTLFVAEIASTFNEHMFLDYLLSKTDDKNEKLALLQQSIDAIMQTYYRQTLFADYELQAHRLVESGKPVTADALSEIMAELYMTYYGIDIKEEVYKPLVWAYIPHFFGSPYYVYQYATSFSASMAIYANVKNNVKGAKDAYISMLKNGGSDYPVNLVKKAGVDMTTDMPFKAVTARMAELVDKLEKLLEE